MVSKKYNESDVRVMFQSFGTIEECTVLRDTNGISKGKNEYKIFSSKTAKWILIVNTYLSFEFF